MDECMEVGLSNLTVAIRIEETVYFWDANMWPTIDGLHREIARAILTHALSNLGIEESAR